MTTKRYTESDIQQFVALQSADVFSVSASDKFGDNGIVGCVILRYEGNVAEIDTFLLSCRVIGRRIENAVFATLVKYLKYKQVIKLNAAFIKTQKNAPAENFYNEVGMLLSGDGLYQLSLEDCLVGFPDCVEMISEAHEG